MGLLGGGPKSQGRKNTSRPSRPQKPKPPKGGSKQGTKGAPK
jgi:hypothetical protein